MFLVLNFDARASGRFALDLDFLLAPVDRFGGRSGCWVLGLAVGDITGLLGSSVSGRGHCRVATFGLGGLRALAVFSITISHCAWQHVISWSLATKKRSKENALTALP